MSVEFETVYPGVYGEREAEMLEAVKAEYNGTGPHVGVGFGVARQFEVEVTRKGILDWSWCWNRYNPLYSDPEYAKNSRYGGLFTAPFGIITGSSFPFPAQETGVWVSSLDHVAPKGLDHEYTFYKPIYEGDVVHSETTVQSITDITPPEGGRNRLFRFQGEGNLVNQNGEITESCVYRGVEVFHVLKEPDDRFRLGRAEYQWPPFTFDWEKVRKPHVYTDEDWEYLKDLWSKEYVRGADTLYWEDVSIGDEPAWCCDGPLTHSELSMMEDEVYDWYGMEKEPMRFNSARDFVMGVNTRDKDTMFRDPYGMWQNKRAFHSEGCNVPNARASCGNAFGRNFTTRVITNWMGDDGWIYKGCWRLLFGWDDGCNMFPEDCDRPSYLLKVPYLKEQGKFMNTHLYEGDVSIAKAYVCDKYVRDGKHYVDLVAWAETIEGDIFSENYFVVELPSREG